MALSQEKNFNKEHEMRFAIQIPFENDWLFVTEGLDLQVKTFDDRDAADDYAKIWPNHRVVEYTEQ